MNNDYKNLTLNDLYKYFCLSTYTAYNSVGKKRTFFSITGKMKKNNIKIYLLFISIIMIISSIMGYEYGGFKRVIIILIICFVTLFVSFVKYTILFRKSNIKIKQLNYYNRELPSNLRPSHVRMLLNDGLIDEVSLASTLLDLIDNGYLQITGVSRKENIFKKNTDITIIRTNKNTSNLLSYELFLIDWFFGDSINEISGNDLQRKLRENDDLNDNYNTFIYLVLLSFPINVFYENNRKKYNMDKKILTYAIIFMIGLFSLLISPYFIFLAIYGISGIIFFCPTYSVNKIGAIQINSWLSVKKFLEDFMNKYKKVEDVALWDNYLTYSLALDVNDNVKKEIFDFFGKDISDFKIISNNKNIKNTFGFSSYTEFPLYKGTDIKDNNYIETLITEEMKKYNLNINQNN